MEERVNPIILTMADGKEYTLEFDRKSIEWAERRGFSMDDLSEHMMIRLPELFHFAFRKHHPTMTKEQTDKILYEEMGGLTEEVVTRLGKLYSQGYESLINSDPKNSKVTITL